MSWNAYTSVIETQQLINDLRVLARKFMPVGADQYSTWYTRGNGGWSDNQRATLIRKAADRIEQLLEGTS